MADIFNEIDEDLRRDQLHKFWSKYSGLLLLVAILIVIGVAGWRGYEYWRDNRAQAEGDQYVAALKMAEAGDFKGAETNLEAFAKTASGAYPALALMRAAGAAQQAGDPEAALKGFDAVAARTDAPVLIAELARVRAGYVALDLEDRAKVDARMKPLAVDKGTYRHAAREILAFAAWKAGDLDAAHKTIETMDADPETPRAIVERTKLLSSLITAATEKKSAEGAAPTTGKAP